MAILLTEYTNELETLTENTADGKKLYIEGNFLMTEAKNRNGRIYPKSVMEKSVEVYQKNYISERRALGELNHPNRPFIDPAEAAIMIESLTWQGNNVAGKALVLNTPKGNIIKGLLEANFKLGVSSRGLGDVREQRGVKMVNSFLLNAIDAVDMPSGQNCYVNSLTEALEWIEEGGVWVQKSINGGAIVKLDEATILKNFSKYLDLLKNQKAK